MSGMVYSFGAGRAEDVLGTVRTVSFLRSHT